MVNWKNPLPGKYRNSFVIINVWFDFSRLRSISKEKLIYQLLICMTIDDSEQNLIFNLESWNLYKFMHNSISISMEKIQKKIEKQSQSSNDLTLTAINENSNIGNWYCFEICFVVWVDPSWANTLNMENHLSIQK